MGRALLVIETASDRAKAVNWIGRAPIGTRVEFKASKRTLPQNDMLWALLTEVSQQLDHGGTKYDPAQWKAIFLHAFGREVSFLPSLDRKTFLPLELSSSDLSKDEMTDFIEFIMKEAGERGVIFKDHRNHEQSNSGSSPSEPDTADGGTPPAPAASDDTAPLASSSDAPPSERETLINFAKDMLSMAADTSVSPAALKAVEREYAPIIKALSPGGIERARSISESVRVVANDRKRLGPALEHFAEVLETTVEHLRGDDDA